METDLTNEIERLAPGAQLSVVWRKAPVVFDAALREVIRQEAEGLCLSALEMVSGAGHDAAHVAAKAPTAMIFIPRARACHITNANIPRRSNVPTARTCCCEACFAPTNCFMVDLNDGFHSAPPDTTPASAPLRPPNAPVATGPTAILAARDEGCGRQLLRNPIGDAGQSVAPISVMRAPQRAGVPVQIRYGISSEIETNRCQLGLLRYAVLHCVFWAEPFHLPRAWSHSTGSR